MIRRAVDADIPALDRLLFQVHQVHHEARPDLFKAGAKKYTDAQLKAILADDKTPVFAARSILCCWRSAARLWATRSASTSSS